MSLFLTMVFHEHFFPRSGGDVSFNLRLLCKRVQCCPVPHCSAITIP
jgi:hypothetical protein